MAGALAGLRVVEMVGLGPGPFAAMMLADHGADVVRIHAKGQRPLFPFLNTPCDTLARGRRSLAIDLKKPGAAQALLAVIGRADALIEGFRPGVMERLGLGPDVCLAHNARLVYGRMTGWGQTGPLAPTVGHDINYIALSGVLAAIGGKEGPPAIPLNLVGDFGGGGLLLAFGMLAALLERHRSGQGQVVDAAMTDGAALLATMFHGFRAAGFWSHGRGDNLLDGGAPFYDVYRCADGGYVAVGALESAFWSTLVDALGLDGAYKAAQADRALWPRMRADLAAAFARAPRAHWEALLSPLDACFAPVLDWDEAPAHPHNAARGTFVDIAGIPQAAPAPRFSRTPPDLPAAAVSPGTHTRAVLREAGLSEDEIAALEESGAV